MAEKKNADTKKPAQKKTEALSSEPGREWLPGKAKVDKDSNEYIIQTNMQLLALPPFNLKTATDEETEDRVAAFFEIYKGTNLKPPVSGLALALGIDRRRIWEIANDNTTAVTFLSPAQLDVIKKAHKSMEVLWESYLENGKINPVAAIFLGKNHFGYKDQADVVVTANGQQDEYSAEDIARKYALPQENDGQKFLS